MLVLSRKRGERIRIGDAVEVTILAISASRVKLGFSGPPDVWIRRDETLRPDQAVCEEETAVAAPPWTQGATMDQPREQLADLGRRD